ncbi:hypothetical protein J4E91_008960 [Alternaria rosae]|nr:hypothetical protein J4E91_008960 [Alternaria rosae]
MPSVLETARYTALIQVLVSITSELRLIQDARLGYDHATVSRPQNDRHTASLQGFKNHGNQNASRGLLLLAADTSTDAVHNEASLEPDNNASTTPVSRRMANSSPISQPIPFSGSRLKRLLPESQRSPSPMTPPGHEPPASITMSPTPIRMFNRPKGKAVEDEYVLPSPVGSNITVAKRGSQKKRSKYQDGGGDEAAAKRKFSNPKMINVVSGRPPPRQRQKPVSERPILRMSGDREARYM